MFYIHSKIIPKHAYSQVLFLFSGLNPYVTDDGDTVTYHCDKCPETFDDPKKLTKHRHDVHGLVKLICNMCDASLINMHFHYAKHLYYTHYFDGKGCYECSVCGKFLSCEESLQKHLKIHDTRELHTCNTCGQRFTLAANLKTHENSHMNTPHVARNRLDDSKKTHQCVHCGLRFSRDAHVKRHILTQHSSAAVVEATREVARKHIRDHRTRKGCVPKRGPGFMPKIEGETAAQARARRKANKKIAQAAAAAMREARQANAQAQAQAAAQAQSQPIALDGQNQQSQHESIPQHNSHSSLSQGPPLPPLPTQVPLQRPVPPPMHSIPQMPSTSMHHVQRNGPPIPMSMSQMSTPTYSHSQLGSPPMHSQISVPMHTQRPGPAHAHSSTVHVNMEQYYGAPTATRDIFNYFKL
ncbi:unnamed protein product [Owenia fusiformis]|uniref:C2H2-type domain-containing protein n=1 Tax=Owenia fusiformis TaxID=6347 RepID=A0A8S4PDX6_OWEFU|nr:unnamed protein product [Owenia fusiformis]